MSLDFQKFLGKIPLGAPWSKYPYEKHLPQHNFTGPGTRLDLRLDNNDNPKPDSKPINRIDQAAYKHDLIYRDNLDLNTRHNADKQMIKELQNIENPTLREKVERIFVTKALQAKLALGAGLSANDKIKYADEIHKQFMKPKHLLKVKVFEKDDIWSADLINMPPQNGYIYCLTVIDLYTRFAWVEPLKNKKGITVKIAFEKIFKESKRHPKHLWVDKGREFFAMKNYKFMF
jgi:hypothetical protein